MKSDSNDDNTKTGKVLSFQSRTTQIDHQTGEITRESTTNVVRLQTEPAYVKLYVEDLSSILDLKDHHALLILELIRKMDFENMVTLTPSSRERICQKLGIQAQTFRNYLTALVKRDIFKRVGHNEFQANPNLFARGSWHDVLERQQAFKMVVTYSPKGKKVETEVAPDQLDLL